MSDCLVGLRIRIMILVILDVVCRYLSLFLLYINIKISKNRC